MNPVTGLGKGVHGDAPGVVTRRAVSSFAVRGVEYERTATDDQMDGDLAGRRLDHVPKIAREVVAEKGTNGIEIEAKAEALVNRVDVHREPLNHAGIETSLSERLVEGRARRKDRRQRAQKMVHAQRRF